MLTTESGVDLGGVVPRGNHDRQRAGPERAYQQGTEREGGTGSGGRVFQNRGTPGLVEDMGMQRPLSPKERDEREVALSFSARILVSGWSVGQPGLELTRAPARAWPGDRWPRRPTRLRTMQAVLWQNVGVGS